MILHLPVYPAKCLVLMNNHEEIWVMAEKLQTELGDPLSKDDLVVGATVIYQYRGKPYEGEILEVKSGSEKTVVEESRSDIEEQQELSNTAKRRRKELTIDNSDDEIEIPFTPGTSSKNKKDKRMDLSRSRSDVEEQQGLSNTAKRRRKELTIDNSDDEVEIPFTPGTSSKNKKDKREEDWTTPKSKGFSRERKHSDEGPKQAISHKLFIPEDDYYTPSRSSQSKPSLFDHQMYPMSRNRSCERDIYDLLESHTKILRDLQRSMAKVLKYIRQPPSDIKPPIHVPHTQGAGPADVKYEMVDDKENEQFVSEDGVNLLTLRGSAPKQYAYNLMEALFTVEEMGTHCYRTNSKTTKPGLDLKRVQLLEDCVKQKFGKEVFEASAVEIRKGCNQKCLDRKRLLANMTNKEQ